MSKAKRCDRCGKYYDLIPENLPGTKTGPKYYMQYFEKLGNLGASVESFDLCPECAQQLTDRAENPDSIFLDKEEEILEEQELTKEAETEDEE